MNEASHHERCTSSLKNRATAALAVGAALLALAGCGSAAANGGGTSSSSAASASDASSKSVTIAISNPLSGPGAFASPIGNDAKAYLEYLNQQGGVNGYKFNVTMFDNQLSTTGGAVAAKQALATKPLALFVAGSPAIPGAATVIKQSDPSLPMFGIADAKTIASSGLSNAYGILPAYGQECQFWAQYAAKTLHVHTLGIVWENDPIGQDTGASCPSYAKQQGVAKVVSIPISATQANFGPVVAQLKNAGATATFVVSQQPLFAGVQKAAVAIGYKPQWMGYSGSDLAWLKLAGSAGEGTLVDAVVEPLDGNSPELTLFKQQVTKQYGSAALIGIGEEGWTLAALIAEGVKDATAGGKALTETGFVSALNAINQGVALAPTVNWAGGSHASAGPDVSLYKVENGKFTLIKSNVPLPS